MKVLGREIDIIPNIVPVDSQAGANAGDYICLKNARGVAIVVFKAPGTANDDPLITIRQAQDVAGTNVKDLVAITTYYSKQALTNLLATGAWTKVTQAAAATVQLNATSAESAGVYVIEVEAEWLDVNNGFDCLVANIGDTGSAGAQLLSSLYILYGLSYPAAPESLPSAIVD